MGMLQISSVSLAVLFILGCAPKQSVDPPPPPAKTVFDPLTQQLGKARDVQQAVDANAENTRKAVEAQEHGDSTP
jgi:hypothetical protein